MKSDQPVVISITFGTVVKSLLAVLLFYLLFVLKDLLLVLLTSVVLASAIEPATKFFEKKRIPRVIGVLITYVITISLLIGIFAAFFPPLIKDLSNIANTLPAYLVELSESDRFSDIPAFSDLLTSFQESVNKGEIISAISTGASGATVGFITTFSSIFGGILSTILIIVFSFYLAVQEKGVENLIRIVVPIRHEKYVVGLWKRSQRKIGLWMQGQLLLSVIIAVLTYLGLSIVGVENALLLALVAGVFELIPVFGPILAAIPAIVFAILQSGMSLGLIVLAIYIIIQQFESQLIHPLVVKKIVGIPALLAIVALIVGAQIAGFLGILISVPVTAAIMEYINDVDKRKSEELKKLEG